MQGKVPILAPMTKTILTIGLLLPTLAVAQPTPTTATPAGLVIGLQASDYRYEEPRIAMSLDGQQLGGNLSYTQVDERGVFGRGELRIAYGKLTYRGSGVANDQPNFIADGRFVAGGDFFAGESFGLASYAGLGYRYLFSDLRGTTSTGARGYRRYSYYFYVPLGLTLRYRAANGLIVAPTLEYDHLVRGRQYSQLSDTGIAGLRDAENAQRNGHGYRAALRFETRGLHFGPWFQHWDITNSDITPIGLGLVGLEPANKTREWGVELGMAF